MILNLSNRIEGLKAVNEIVYQALTPGIIDIVVQGNIDEMFSDTLTYIIEAFEKKGLYISLEELEWKLDSEFCNRFKYIKGFHACRITDENSYQQFGLHGLNNERLLKLAIKCFKDYASPEKIANACENTKLPKYDNGVYFFTTYETTKDPAHNHYLKCGCETLHGLLHDLDIANRRILSSKGHPCIIECNIPVDEIKSSFRIDIWKQLTTVCLQSNIIKTRKLRFPDLCFSTKGDVPPEHIKYFHYVNDSEIEYRLPLH